MKDKKYLRSYPENAKSKYNEMDFDIDAMALTNEYTGLIPTAPVSKAQAEAYNSLYPQAKPLGKKSKRNKK